VVFSGSSTNKTDSHDMTEILLKVALNTIKQTYFSISGVPLISFFTSLLFILHNSPDLTWRDVQHLEDTLSPMIMGI
jgi:hypothetical protein